MNGQTDIHMYTNIPAYVNQDLECRVSGGKSAFIGMHKTVCIHISCCMVFFHPSMQIYIYMHTCTLFVCTCMDTILSHALSDLYTGPGVLFLMCTSSKPDTVYEDPQCQANPAYEAASTETAPEKVNEEEPYETCFQ